MEGEGEGVKAACRLLVVAKSELAVMPAAPPERVGRFSCLFR